MPENEPEPEKACVQVVYPDGQRIYEPLADYLRNPPVGTWVYRESRKVKPERTTVRRLATAARRHEECAAAEMFRCEE